ncbi:RNA polymerase sigma factor [Paucibacter sp. R3-3]|uniref:RNA polymerase sigma factor n=2 Tax=Roseateles agri TaxID=3098619 RepID=A0ABU5DRQ8_9BURK|nr:RNA polymerase sigma factor [Paucibacter sp. R3-3]MDY0749002.1 RNA polymerase sigma factor [Paucibacter sp. R3-3]
MQIHRNQLPSLGASTTDTELVQRATGGEAAAFEAIMRRHNRLLFRTARSIVRSDPEAADILQEAYLRAWRGIASFRAEAKLSTWLVRIVVNEALGRLRSRDANVNPLDVAVESTDAETQAMWHEDPDNGPDRMVMRAQMRRLIEAHIDVLPDAFRSVFLLRAVEELSVEEVSEVLGIPEATVRTRFFRARSLMREGLSRDIDMATCDAFSFDGERCDRIVAAVLTRLPAS